MSEVGSMETGKADDKALCMKRCPDTGEMCKLTAGHQGRHDPMGIGELPDKWDALRKADDEEAERFANAFIEVVNADNDDMITINRDIGCRIRDHIENLRRELRGMERGGEGIREALTELVRKLELIHADERYKGVWTHYMIHGMKYTGPNYASELEAAKTALATLSVTEGVDGREK